jgi:2-(1,2-epoxy-1,2-dihydrophenyl)acetyl-CoA isomerase
MDTIDTGTDHLLAEVGDGVAVLTMNRPASRNALSGVMLAGLQQALRVCETSREVACVVLTGAGGAFCAGGDVKGFAAGEMTSGKGPTFDEAVHQQRLDQRAT